MGVVKPHTGDVGGSFLLGGMLACVGTHARLPAGAVWVVGKWRHGTISRSAARVRRGDIVMARHAAQCGHGWAQVGQGV